MAIVIEKRTNLDAPIKVDSLNGGVMFTTEAEAHQFVVRCEQEGQELTLAGTISARLVRADGNTVELIGSISDGAAVVTLTQDCYNVQGRFQLAVFNSVGNTKLCIYACVGYIQKAQSGNLIDGGDIIPDVEDLIADIQAAVESIPPSYTTLLASIAGTYSASKTYSVGEYAWYNGTLYRCSTAISTAEAWTSGHWTAAVLGDDLSSLKSAIAYINNSNYSSVSFVSDGLGYINANTGTKGSHTVAACTALVYVGVFKNIKYKRTKHTGADPAAGMAFYNAEGTYISGVAGVGSQSAIGYVDELYKVAVPTGAKFARFTYWADTETYGDFAIYGITNISYDITNNTYAIEAVSKGNSINLVDVFEIENGYYYEWNTGIKRQNANYSAIKIKISDGESLNWITANTKGCVLTRWKNGAYVNGVQTVNLAANAIISGAPEYDMLIYSTQTGLENAEIFWIGVPNINELANKIDNTASSIVDLSRGIGINLIDVIGFEKGFFYEWNTGIKKPNANWGNIKIPIIQGETVLYQTPGTKSIHLTRWKNGAYVSGYSSGSAPADYSINGEESFDEIIISSEITSLESANITYTNNANKVFYVNPGDSIKEILSEAIKTYGSTVYINPGTYDLIEEYGGTAAIDAGSSETFGRGIVVGNGVKIISTPAAKIVCNYTGTNSTFKTTFSPFTAHDENNNSMNGDFEVIGLNIEASNCRYAFHDDLGYATTEPYRHVFRDCKFSFDNSGNTSWNGDQCIGGGLGDYGLIEIYNCEFETVQTKANECNDVSYHANARNSNPLTESNVYIKDCWFSHTFSARYYNTFETVSNFYMSNCSVSEAPYVRAETSGSTVVNVALKAWNNVIRT